MPFRKSILAHLALVVAIIALIVPCVLAQDTATLTGAVKDATGAVVPGVEVTITNAGTGDARTVLSSDNGSYRVTNLRPGNFEVKAVLTGFKTALATVTLTVGEVGRVDLLLEVGDINEVITVTNAGSVIDVETSRVSGLVTAKQITDLPLNGRNVFQLMQTLPGAVNSTSTIDEPGQNTNVNGGRANMNGFWMDGITIKGLSGGTGAGDGPGQNPNLEMVQEFRMETLNFSAEFGNSIGSVVNVITKSGTNEYHGSVYNFLRNDNLDAREFFDDQKPEFKQNQFGASFGGPIVKNKTFFFGTYEGLRVRTAESRLATFESPEWNQFAQRYGAPVARFLYQNYPAPPISSVTETVGEYLTGFGYIETADQASVDSALFDLFGAPAGTLNVDDAMTGETSYFTPDSSDSNGFSVRLDHEFSDNDKVYGRYYYNKLLAMQFVDPRPAFSSPVDSRNHYGALNWSHVFSPVMINEARAGFTRNTADIGAGAPGVPYIIEWYSGTSTFGAYNGYPQIFRENIYTWADTMSWNVGDHGLKMGGEIRRNQENSDFNVARPSTSFYDLIYIALDDPYYQVAGVNPHLDQPGNAELESNQRGWRSTELGFFFNDDWKVRPNLTLNLGIRWDWYSRLTEVQNRATAYQMDRGETFVERVRYGDFVGPVDKLSPNDWNNFAPRVGFAWDPFSDGKMSVRGGLGVAYQSGIFNPLANSRWNKPFYSFNLVCDVCGRDGEVILYGPQDGSEVRIDGPNPNPGAANLEGNIIAYEPTNDNRGFVTGIPDPSIRDPYSISYFFGIQRELIRDTSIEVNYVANLGRKLIRAENPNRFPGDYLGWASPVGEFEGDEAGNRLKETEGRLRFWQNAVNSNYHSLQAGFTKRYSSGFSINANYTWSKVLDTRSTWHSGSTSSNGAQEGYSTDWFNVHLDYGRAVFDARHRFVMSFLWDFPFFQDSDSWAMKNIVGGWQVNANGVLQSGQPYTPFVSLSFFQGGDFNADTERNDRPNTPSVGNKLSCTNHDFVNRDAGCFNVAGGTSEKLDFFGRPEPGSNGTLGRNTYEGPAFNNLDFSLFKNIGIPQLTEEAKVQIRFEFFNVLNRPNFYQPDNQINSSTFGRATDAFDAREIQIGLKLLF